MRIAPVLAVVLLFSCASPLPASAQASTAADQVQVAPRAPGVRPVISAITLRNRGTDEAIVLLALPTSPVPFRRALRLSPGEIGQIAVPRLPIVQATILRRDEFRRAEPSRESTQRRGRDNALRLLGLGLALAGNGQSGQAREGTAPRRDHRSEREPPDEREDHARDRHLPPSSADDHPADHRDRDRAGAALVLGAVLADRQRKDRDRAEPRSEGDDDVFPGEVVLLDGADGAGTRIVDGLELEPLILLTDEPDDRFAGEDAGIPISNDPQPPGNAAAAPCYCGPDMTAAYVEALGRVRMRIDALPDSEKGPYDGSWFLHANGSTLDIRVAPAQVPGAATVNAPTGEGILCPTGSCSNLPGPGGTTMSLFGHCLPQHVGNDIMYAFAATLLGMPYGMLVLGGDYAQYTAYGSLDPPSSKAAYAIGIDLATLLGASDYSIEKVDPLFHHATYHHPDDSVPAKIPYQALGFIQRYYPALANCERCPRDATEPGELVRDWSRSEWTLNDGSRVGPPAGN